MKQTDSTTGAGILWAIDKINKHFNKAIERGDLKCQVIHEPEDSHVKNAETFIQSAQNASMKASPLRVRNAASNVQPADAACPQSVIAPSDSREKPTPILITPREFKSIEDFIEWQRERDLFEQTTNEAEERQK